MPYTKNHKTPGQVENHKNACVKYPYTEEDFQIFSGFENTPIQIYTENFVMWLQVNE